MPKLPIVLIILALILFSSGLVAGKGLSSSGGSTTSTTSSTASDNNRDDTTWVEPSVEDNTYSNTDIARFGEKLITSLPDVPDGNPTKVIVSHGDSNEVTWEQINNDFVNSDNFFESDSDKSQYLKENDAFANGEPTTFAIHMKQCQRLISFAADKFDLNNDIRFMVPLGTIKTESKGHEYDLPAVGEISHDRDETGNVVYPSIDKVGITDNDPDFKAPFATSEFDNFEWYSVTV
jgi:hypothetical protein